jgi:hypothetical protein
MTIERKVTSSSRNAAESTNANTYGRLPVMASLKSPVAAASPEVYASTPSIFPTVPGTMSSRRASTARLDSSSVPLPVVGSVTVATV